MMMEILDFQTSICHLVSDSGTAVQPRTRTLARSYRLALFARIFLRTTDQCRPRAWWRYDLDHLLSRTFIMLSWWEITGSPLVADLAEVRTLSCRLLTADDYESFNFIGRRISLFVRASANDVYRRILKYYSLLDYVTLTTVYTLYWRAHVRCVVCFVKFRGGGGLSMLT